MRVAVGLPTHRVDRPGGFLTGDAVAEIARAAEEAGFDAVFVTDHPFPGDRWLASGGHHTLDPMVALSFRRAVELADGWMPFPNPAAEAERARERPPSCTVAAPGSRQRPEVQQAAISVPVASVASSGSACRRTACP